MSEPDEVKPGSQPESPLAVGRVSQMVSDYISRLGAIWVEGQLSEVSLGRGLSFLSLRDIDADAMLKLHASPGVIEAVSPKIEQGSRVIAQVKADWWTRKGTMQFKVLQIRAVGLGELMARLEALKSMLAAEGLFAAERKKDLPFLPRRIGLVCGKNSDAMHDVIENAKRRWPDAVFEVREVKVQGVTAVREVSQAIRELDAIDDIDVIVVTRGGGSFEDLLPFSDESLIRIVANAITPIVAAIGHEEDRPIIDYVADFRASTPTDAARRIVPDVEQEVAALANARSTMRQIVEQALTYREQQLAVLRSRPALANPAALIDQRMVENHGLRTALHSRVTNKITLESAHLHGAQSTLRALSPQGTLERGFAIVRTSHGEIVKNADSVSSDENLCIRFAEGEIDVRRTS
jgi:exodeoxyribonuclease VII large subunit